MMQNQSRQQITEYLDLLKRGKYFVIVPIIICVVIGCAVAFKLPPVYRSEVKIFYMQAQVPKNMFVQAINMYLESAIVFIEAVTFSRENSLKLIQELNLYPDLVDEIPEDDLIAHMKEHYAQKYIYTEIPDKNSRVQEVITGFELFFDHRDPRKAFEAVKNMATRFIENYRSFREGFATQTSSFFVDEKQRLKEEITDIDQKISEFKKRNIDSLPELFQSNYRMLETLNQNLLTLDQETRLLKEKKINLESRLATVNPLISMEGMSGQRIVSPEEKRTALKSELAILLTTYSEKHPDVIRARGEIDALERGIAERKKNMTLKAGDAGNRGSGTKELHEESQTGAYNPAYINLKTQLEAINLEIKSVKKERARTEKEIREYQFKVGRTPLVEKEYNALNRDLESAQRRYNELVNQVLSLESSAAMEKRQMGGRLTIGQPPTFPLRPIKPNRLLIIAASFFAGTGLGVLLLLAWDSITRTVRTPQDLLKLTQVPVLSEIPLIMADNRGGKRVFSSF